MKKTIAVIGSGISGITISAALQDVCDVTVFERSPYIGGLVHCNRVEGYLYHRVGGHVFNSKNKEVLEWFWSKFDKEHEFIETKRNAKILYKDNFIGYPIENFIYQLDAPVITSIMKELLSINQTDKKDPMSWDNFELFLKGNFGDTLYEIYFKPYNQKIWKTDLSTVSMHWLEGKLPMPNLLEIVTSNIQRKEEGNMVHSTFYYPKSGGSQFIADRLAKGLSIVCSTLVESIQLQEGKSNIAGEWFDHVVYTGDVRRLPSMLAGLSGQDFKRKDELKKLRSNGTSSVLCECDANDLSWLYIPEPHYKAHRIIYTGNFSNTNNSPLSNRSSCTVEFSGICSNEEMKKELTYLPGNLSPIAYNNEPESYVIQDHVTRNLIQEYKNFLSPLGIHLLGRFGEWEYYNMDKAIEAAFELKKKIT